MRCCRCEYIYADLSVRVRVPCAPLFQFHERYLALIDAVAASGLCRNSSVVMMYVGYASASYGDEYIGPSATNDNPEQGSGDIDATDPAAYAHVKQRLDKWADACAGVPHKVLMGGESAYGSSLGFGTRNGFVEHCELPPLPRPPARPVRALPDPCCAPLAPTSSHALPRPMHYATLSFHAQIGTKSPTRPTARRSRRSGPATT
jgi:hypothetical protein